ncbi:cep57 cep57-mt-bd: centrosome microtubule-binding domain protein [Phaffia rhodozyma]|uniref:Cep57 cep57-mt-bd: centrosome microtubule-binding domain protein n=1 Tax=Phaffia rhodozyma TaxID=264483 RepID=A0A0F7SNU9_PHARH|nr:cep57 cep57-mt-bd: centrosome microtubule-binding domain protein [Phaffia rhodozyma]
MISDHSFSSSSSSSTTHQPSPSPSPRSMRRKSNQAGPFSLRQSPSLSNSFPPPSAAAHRHASSSASSLLIPHSHDDLDRIRLEEQLGGISLMSSSRASSSVATSTRTGTSFATERDEDDDAYEDEDEDGSSIEVGRAAHENGNLSAIDHLHHGHGLASFAQPESFSTVTGFPSPVSTAGHHASAITLRTGLTGGQHNGRGGGHHHHNQQSGFDSDRELAPIIKDDKGLSFGLGDSAGESPLIGTSGLPLSMANSNANPIGRPKLVDAIAQDFSPRRPSSRSNGNRYSANTAAAARTGSLFPTKIQPPLQESKFEMLARGIESNLPRRQSGPIDRQPMSELSFNESREFNSISSLKRGNSNGQSVARRNANKPGLTKKKSTSRGQSSFAAGLGDGKSVLFLPDVTGLTDGLVESPARRGKKTVKEGDHREDSHAYPIESLATLSQKLSSLTSENKETLQRVSELELELQTTRERETAAKQEWALEREYLRRELSSREQTGLERGRREVEETTSAWETRYWEVVQEKKALESLVAELRSEVSRLTKSLQEQTALIEQLREQRALDQAELQRRGNEIDSLREEVRTLATEVGSLRRVVEDTVGDRRAWEQEREQTQAQERERYQDQLQRQFQQQQEQQRETVIDQDQDRTIRPISPRVGRNKVGADELARLRTTISSHQTNKRASPAPLSTATYSERPGSRLSEGLRVAAVSSPTRSPPLLSSSPRFASQQLDAVYPAAIPLPRSPDLDSSSIASSPRRQSRRRAMAEEREKAQKKVLEPIVLETAWASSFEQEELVIDEDQEEVPVEKGALSPKIRSREPTTSSSSQQKRADGQEVRLPPQTVLCRVLRELEVEYEHYKVIYTELADQYKQMDPASNVAKRNILAEHLKEVIDNLEQKGDQIASLYSLLTFADRPLPSTSSTSTAQRKAYRSVQDLLHSVQTSSRRKEGTA